jgi:hypothetical protein
MKLVSALKPAMAAMASFTSLPTVGGRMAVRMAVTAEPVVQSILKPFPTSVVSNNSVTKKNI